MIFEETVILSKPFAEAVHDVKAAFAAVGFGTLTEIDMRATLKAKIDEDIEPYVIIGACNPTLASKALKSEPQIGVLLPCNVVVRQSGDDVIVEAMDPGLMASMTGNPDISPIATEARHLINDALSRLTATPELVTGSSTTDSDLRARMMTTESKITCPNCHTRNRVSITAAGKPRCAKCHADLPWLADATTSDFDQVIAASSLPILVDLWAPWCGPCRAIAPALEHLAQQRAGSLRVVKVNVDEEPALSTRLGVQGIPTMLLYDRGNETGRQVGALPADRISQWVDSLLANALVTDQSWLLLGEVAIGNGKQDPPVTEAGVVQHPLDLGRLTVAGNSKGDIDPCGVAVDGDLQVDDRKVIHLVVENIVLIPDSVLASGTDQVLKAGVVSIVAYIDEVIHRSGERCLVACQCVGTVTTRRGGQYEEKQRRKEAAQAPRSCRFLESWYHSSAFS